MAGPKASFVVCALEADRSPGSGWVKNYGGGVAEPREVWLNGAQMWVREDGRRVSGWDTADEYFARTFRLIDAIRIRMAVRRWAARSEERRAGE